MPATLVRDRLTWLTYAQLSAWAYFFYGFGPVVPLLRDEQHTSRTVASLHGTAFAVGGILNGVVQPYLVRRFGRRVVIWIGLAGVSLSTLGFAVCHALPETVGLALVGSLCGGMVANAATALLAGRHGAGGAAAISEANAAAAGVGLVAPLVVGLAVSAGLGWRTGFATVIGVVVLVLVAATIMRVPAPPPAPEPAQPPSGHLPRLYWLVWTSIIATGSVEVCLNLWVADVLRTHAHVSPGGATAAVSAVVGGMCLGRAFGSRLTLRLPGTAVLLGALGLSACGFAVFWLATGAVLAVVGLVITGLGNALHYPVGMALAVQHSGGQPDLGAARTSYALGLAFGLAPFALGALADRIGPHPAFLMLPAFLAVSATAVTLLRRRTPVPAPVG